MKGTNGLIETAAVGAGDHHMARAIVGEARSSFPSGVSEGYARPILQWERRALNHIQKSIGYLPHTIEHFWHGPKPKRRYIERWDIVIKHQFDPFEDLKRNVFGVLNSPATNQTSLGTSRYISYCETRTLRMGLFLKLRGGVTIRRNTTWPSSRYP